MKLYTKTGDDGTTGLFGGPRVNKDDPRIEAYGTVDELNSVVGLVRAEGVDHELDQLLNIIQNDLFSLGAELATPEPVAHGTRLIGAIQIAVVEGAIDRYDADVEPLKQFVLPGGSKGAALLHLARTICRRAERELVLLVRESQQPIAGELVVYLNRLSDLLFVAARWANKQAGVVDVPWTKPDPGP
jgi:cob(I)alamin adenosyltransferase